MYVYVYVCVFLRVDVVQVHPECIVDREEERRDRTGRFPLDSALPKALSYSTILCSQFTTLYMFSYNKMGIIINLILHNALHTMHNFVHIFTPLKMNKIPNAQGALMYRTMLYIHHCTLVSLCTLVVHLYTMHHFQKLHNLLSKKYFPSCWRGVIVFKMAWYSVVW